MKAVTILIVKCAKMNMKTKWGKYNGKKFAASDDVKIFKFSATVLVNDYSQNLKTTKTS